MLASSTPKTAQIGMHSSWGTVWGMGWSSQAFFTWHTPWADPDSCGPLSSHCLAPVTQPFPTLLAVCLQTALGGFARSPVSSQTFCKHEGQAKWPSCWETNKINLLLFSSRTHTGGFYSDPEYSSKNECWLHNEAWRLFFQLLRLR